jgi:ubiquinone/menaquinone biosynthesis C-methylase UbiE
VRLITCNVTVEHLSDPDAVFREFFRVLVPGGRLLIHTPNAASHFVLAARLMPPPLRRRLARMLDGRPLDDVYPTFYRANTPTRITGQLRAAGFRSIACRIVASDATVKRWPLVTVLELLWIRATLTRWGRWFRVSMIVSASR